MSDKVTVKQTINKATSIYKIEHITVGKPGSEQYRHAFELADQLGLKHPDCIEHVFPTYADEQCTHVLTEEDFFCTEEREGVDRCIGVICSSVSYELFPNVHEDGGVKWSTKTGHRVRVFSSIDFPIRLGVTHRYIRAVLVRCNIQRYNPLWRELPR